MLSYARLYRVFPWLESAGPNEPGHPLYIPRPQGHGRIDNPEHYLTLYLCDEPDGAIGEAFANHAIWTPDLLDGPPSLAGSRRALGTYDASDADVIDLDDARALSERRLRPSEVVTRNRRVTQAWALDIFREGQCNGIRWWSYHNPEWGSFGIWNVEALRVTNVVALTDAVDRVQQVAWDLGRVWEV